jgi:hypothetical protein
VDDLFLVDGGNASQLELAQQTPLGLGTHDRVDSVEIRWPSGTIDRFTDLAAGTGYFLREGDPPRPLAGFSKAGAKSKDSGMEMTRPRQKMVECDDRSSRDDQ